MIIPYNNFEIEVGEHSYDLYHKRPPKQRHLNKNVGDEVRVSLGYFTKLDSCIEKIIQIELFNRKEIIDLPHFLELYRSLKEDIINTVNDY